MKYGTITAKKLTPTVGAEIGDIDLTKPLSKAQVEDLHQAFADHMVLFFRDQQMNFENLMALVHAFGESYSPPVTKPWKDPAHPEIERLHIDENWKWDVPGEAWHSDMSCEPNPPLGSILYLHTVPETGGDTVFSSMYAAYDALSDRMKQHLEGLTAVHDARFFFAHAVSEPDKLPRHSHPVIRTHPVTKRKTIYVSEGFTTRIEGVSREESEALLGFLTRHVQRPEFQCRFRWRPHSIAFWDNRALQHSAIGDYHPAVRSGYRVTILGDQPYL